VAVVDVLADPAVSPRFKVMLSHFDLGTFISCEGLGAEVVLEQREEGGNNTFVHQLPVRLKYPNIKLTRPVNADSALVARWFASMEGEITRTEAEISALGVDDQEITAWRLQGVIPVRWQGPSLNVDTAKVATETLELAHHGFLRG
jgi:phage tail-like protein